MLRTAHGVESFESGRDKPKSTMKLFEKASWLLLLCALVTVSCVVTDDEDEDENVRASSSKAITALIELEDHEEFLKLVIDPQENNSADKPWLIRVYNSECAKCTILQPHWDAVVAKAAEEGLEFHLGQISYYSNPSSAMRLKVGSLPTLVLYEHLSSITVSPLTLNSRRSLLNSLEFSKLPPPPRHAPLLLQHADHDCTLTMIAR